MAAMEPVPYDPSNPRHSMRRKGVYLLVRRWTSDMALDAPPLNHEGQKIVQLCRCPYAQLTCYQCINTLGGKSYEPLGKHVWVWDCLLCQEEAERPGIP